LVLSIGFLLPLTSRAAAQPAERSPSAAASQLPATIASPAAVPAAPATSAAPEAIVDRGEIIGFLGTVIDWRKQINSQITLTGEPEETLFVADDHRMAAEVVQLAFAFGHAAALLVQDGTNGEQTHPAAPVPSAVGAKSTGASGAATVPALKDLIQRRDQLQTLLGELEGEVGAVHNQMEGANRTLRDSLSREAAAKQAQADLVQSRIESIDTLIDFEKSTGASGASPLGLDAQIEELEQSVARPGDVSATAAAQAGATASVLPGNLERLRALHSQGQALDAAKVRTDSLVRDINGLRQKFIVALAAIDRQGLSQTVQLGNTDLATTQRITAEFKALTARSKLISNALEPLSKQIVLLELYNNNLVRWRTSVGRRLNEELRRLLLSALSLALVLGAVFAGAAVWRHLTFRYVEDIQRRQKLLQVRRVVLIATLALVVIFGFASELGTLATVMGFAAAGIALALQNVILSIAGYFYLSGRFGIRMGDRVQIAGVTGDVLEMGFFKLTLIELAEEERGRLPTGRAVIFPNAVVFQPNSNFFRQLPGTSFVWNELRLTLAPDCDYRQAEQLVTGVVDEVFTRYRDHIQRESRAIENRLNLRVETPRPQSRLQLSPDGLEMVVRYPTHLAGATQTADEITRRLVDAIRREPGLKLAVPGVPSIQTEIEPEQNFTQAASKA
jgi:small-conductance mechanosensitive channel